MGKVEKVIVLSVLFLIALILVVSLTVEDPLQKNRAAQAAGGAAASGSAEAAAMPQNPAQGAAHMGAGAAGTSSLLSTNVSGPVTTTPGQPELSRVQPGAALNAPGAQALPAGAILVTNEGLEDSYVPDMKFYTWKDGDTYRAVANRYYGDWTRLTLLRKFNEGRVDVKPGQKIHVPVFDVDAQDDAMARNVAPAEPVPFDSSKAKSAKSAKSAASKSATASSVDASGNKIHVVLDGESLWKIAKKELGSGARWKEIYEANKDVLSSPEAVKKGMKLRVP